MNEREFTTKVRHLLNQGAYDVNRQTANKLMQARQAALAHQKVAPAQLSLAGMGHMAADVLLPQARTLVALLGLSLAVIGVTYWNNYEQALENEEIDSALLADELPINAYLDRGFHVWLEQPSSPQQ